MSEGEYVKRQRVKLAIMQDVCGDYHSLLKQYQKGYQNALAKSS